MVEQYLRAVSSAGAAQHRFAHHAVARGIDGVAHAPGHVHAAVEFPHVVFGVHAVAERSDLVAQLGAVDGPYCGYCGGELLLVFRQRLQFVERDRFEIEAAGELVEFAPCGEHRGRIVVADYVLVFLVVVRRIDPLHGERVGRKEGAVDVIVAMAYLLEFALRRADSVLQDLVSELQLAVLVDQTVEFGGVEQRRKEYVGYRYDDEPYEHVAYETVRLQTVDEAPRLALIYFFIA